MIFFYKQKNVFSPKTLYILFGQSENSFYRVFGIHFKGIQKVLSFAHIGGKMITEILNLIGLWLCIIGLAIKVFLLKKEIIELKSKLDHVSDK